METIHKLLTDSLHLCRMHGTSLLAGQVVFVGRGHMNYRDRDADASVLRSRIRAPPHPADEPGDHELAEQPFLREYGMGVLRMPMDGGKIYGWKLNETVTFGRFKGENDEFGFSFEVDSRQRVEVTTDGVRWRKAIGGPN